MFELWGFMPSHSTGVSTPSVMACLTISCGVVGVGLRGGGWSGARF